MLPSACGGNTGLAALDRAATAEDVLPADVNFSPGFVPDGTRLLATEDGLRFYAAQDADLRPQGKIVNMSSTPMAVSAALVADGNDPQLMESDGWTRVHGNVYIKR